MKVNISIADVRKVCETLLAENGDVFETSRKTNVSTDDVRRIKDGRYMKSISASYFDANKWNTSNTSVREPDPVQLVMDDFETKESEPETHEEPKKTKSETVKHAYAKITDSMVREICEMLLTGSKHGDIAEKFNISMSAVSTIRRKKTWRVISDEYFELVSEKGTAIRNIKTGEIVINPKDRWCTLQVENKGSVIVGTTDNHTRDIIDEITDLAVKYITLNKIDDLPEPIKTKVLDVIKSEVANMSISQIKELTNNG